LAPELQGSAPEANMTIKKIFGATAALGIGFVLAACGRDEPAMSPAAGVEPRVSAVEAVDAITDARCNYEQKCGNIAASEEFQSRDHCLQVIRADMNQELGEDEDCRNGVSQRNLQECLSELASKDCGGLSGVIDSMDTYMSCGSNSLCMD